MTTNFTLAKLPNILDCSSLNLTENNTDSVITGITTDSRYLKPGEVFLALQGENFDGHDFINMAVEKGALGIITDGRPMQFSFNRQIPQFQVSDTLAAYQKIARWWRDQFTIPVIGITGSVGKTTTKELIAALLSTQGNVLKTQANYNNEIGVPKTLLGINNSHNYAVIEMAMRAKGEIALLTQIARPTIGIITNVGTAHIGRLGSEQAIADAKCELLAEMSSDSLAILNYDNERLMTTAASVWHNQTITYGLTGGNIHGQLIDTHTLLVDGIKFPLPLPGKHNAVNYLAGLAVAKVLGIDWQVFTQGLNVTLPDGRAKRYQLDNDIVVLDETYNAGLESMLAALNLLAQTPGKRHIAVLGTMKELGERSPEFHYRVGLEAKNLNLDQVLVLVDDPETVEIARGADGIDCECFNNHDDLLNKLKSLIKSGDRILFKASHSVGLDKVVQLIIDN
ncbi:MAG TPA: UDP-N-acetylmuramoyl-tripeptide--D-alanyl-D-alanine ligase [Allocoleopsis sp.]